MKYIHKVSGYTAVPCDTLPEHYDIRDNQNKLSGYFPSEMIEGSNDWELQIEKDYEILSFLNSEDPKHNFVATKREDGKFRFADTKMGFEESDFIRDKHPIHSVKRISDGQVFVLGDKVAPFKSSKFGEIGEFIITVFNTVYVTDKYKTWGIDLSDIKKKPLPIFTTEDGVDMYGDEDLWEVYGKEEKSIAPVRAKILIDYLESPNRKAFSTKEAAQEYLDKEKKERVLFTLIRKHTKRVREVSMEGDQCFENVQLSEPITDWNSIVSELYDTLTKK